MHKSEDTRQQDLQHSEICASHQSCIHLVGISFRQFFSGSGNIFSVIDKYQPNVPNVTLDAIVNKLHLHHDKTFRLTLKLYS